MEIKHKDLEKAMRKAYKTGIALFISGTTGIGKSQTVKKVASDLAKDEVRQLLEWNKISDKEKVDLFESKTKREKSFILADIRASLLDPSDLRGLPNLNGKDFVEWKSILLFRVLSLDGIKGILFFDELNQSPPSVMNACFQIILDRAIGEISLNPDICRVACGNRLEDKAQIFEMSVPLKARFNHFTLAIPTYQEWVEWGLANGIDDRILTFIQWRPSHLMVDINKLKDMKSNAIACPRTWAFLSTMIDGEKDLDDLEMYTSSCVGDGVAIEFKAFLKLREKIDLKKILDEPEKARDLEIDIKWSLIGLVSETYRGDKKILDKALNLCNFLEPDFGASLLRMVKRQDEKHFTANCIKCKSWRQIADKFAKYIRVGGE